MGYIISRTGSRGALIALAVLYLVVMYHASLIGKAGLLLVGSLSICAAMAFLPSALKDRYKTIFSQERPGVVSPGEPYLLVSAETSTESREHLFRQSLILTAHHPLFGVGAGQFVVAENSLSMSQGRRKGNWLGTHNSYLQVASETGVMGLFFFVSILILSLKKAHALYTATKDRPELKEICTQAEALFLSLLCLAITDMFIHAAYTMLLPVLAGMTIALEYTTRPLLAQARPSRVTAMPAAMVRQIFPRRVPVAGASGQLSGAS
jgi:O-antigen ligase